MELNKLDGATVAELSRSLRVPRASLYRILETLCRDGFLERHPADHRYRLTIRVRSLSAGFSDDHYLAAIARPDLEAVTRLLRWPVSLGTLAGTEVVVRESTDDQSPLAAYHFGIGYRMSVLTTATGLCLLAHLGRARRDALLEELTRRNPDTAMSARERASLENRLREIRTRGFCALDRRRLTTDATSIAVPVLDSAAVVRAAITLRFAKAAVAQPVAIAKFVPRLRQAARRIAARATELPR